MTDEMSVVPPPPAAGQDSPATSDVDVLKRACRVAWFVAAGGWLLAAWTGILLGVVTYHGNSDATDAEPFVTGLADVHSLQATSRVRAIKAWISQYADDPESIEWVQFDCFDGGDGAEPFSKWIVWYRATNSHGARELFKEAVDFEPGTPTYAYVEHVQTVTRLPSRPQR